MQSSPAHANKQQSLHSYLHDNEKMLMTTNEVCGHENRQTKKGVTNKNNVPFIGNLKEHCLEFMHA